MDENKVMVAATSLPLPFNRCEDVIVIQKALRNASVITASGEDAILDELG